MRTRRTALVAAVLFMSTGCSIKILAKRVEKQGDKMADTICGCDVLADALEEGAGGSCEDFFGFYEFGGCEIDALELDKKASRESLSCALEGLEEVNNCLDKNFECSLESDSYETCLNKADEMDCPELPDEVNDALEKCYIDDYD